MKRNLFYIAITSILLTSCHKFLDQKSDQSLNVPTTIKDFQSLMDDVSAYYRNDQDVAYSICGADELYVTDDNWTAMATRDVRYQTMYKWGRTGLYNTPSSSSSSWILYQQIYKSNLILDQVGVVKNTSAEELNNVKGQAYFYRGRAYLRLMNLHCPAYEKATAVQTLGMPLNLSSDFNVTYRRSSLAETVSQIRSDLDQAAALLPATTVHPTRPGKAAAYGYLSRLYLVTGQFDSCYKYSQLALEKSSYLIDYNIPEVGFDPSNRAPFVEFNKEHIHSTKGSPDYVMYYAYVDTALYKSYDLHDLRKSLYFTNSTTMVGYFKGSYCGYNSLFTGIAVDEMYLNRAESLVRLGRTNEGLSDLNTLLEKRFETGYFTPITGLTREDALQKVLEERKKELVFRGLRWSDIKRLNVISPDIEQVRWAEGQKYTLAPNASFYAYPIPDDVVNQYHLQQNP